MVHNEYVNATISNGAYIDFVYKPKSVDASIVFSIYSQRREHDAKIFIYPSATDEHYKLCTLEPGGQTLIMAAPVFTSRQLSSSGGAEPYLVLRIFESRLATSYPSRFTVRVSEVAETLNAGSSAALSVHKHIRIHTRKCTRKYGDMRKHTHTHTHTHTTHTHTQVALTPLSATGDLDTKEYSYYRIARQPDRAGRLVLTVLSGKIGDVMLDGVNFGAYLKFQFFVLCV
jgi:hypothetical protein